MVQFFHFQERDDVLLQIHEQLDEMRKTNWSIEDNIAICPVVHQIEQYLNQMEALGHEQRECKSKDWQKAAAPALLLLSVTAAAASTPSSSPLRSALPVNKSRGKSKSKTMSATLSIAVT